MSDDMRRDKLRAGGFGEARGDDGPPPIEEEIAERLLEGTLAAERVPPAYDRVVGLLKAAAGPPRPDELAGEKAAVAAFRAAYADAAAGHPSNAPGAGNLPNAGAIPTAAVTAAAPHSHGMEAGRPLQTILSSPRTATAPVRPGLARPGKGASSRRPARRITRPAALLVALLVLGGLGASATAAILTADNWRTTPRSAATTTLSADPPASGAGPNDTTPAVPPDRGRPGRSLGTGPGNAKSAERSNEKLCHTWQAGKADRSRSKSKAAALEALTEAAGGAHRVDAYCKEILRESPSGKKPAPHQNAGQQGGGQQGILNGHQRAVTNSQLQGAKHGQQQSVGNGQLQAAESGHAGRQDAGEKNTGQEGKSLPGAVKKPGIK
jgi:hypothetical protein